MNLKLSHQTRTRNALWTTPSCTLRYLLFFFFFFFLLFYLIPPPFGRRKKKNKTSPDSSKPPNSRVSLSFLFYPKSYFGNSLPLLFFPSSFRFFYSFSLISSLIVFFTLRNLVAKRVRKRNENLNVACSVLVGKFYGVVQLFFIFIFFFLLLYGKGKSQQENVRA